MSQDEVVVLHLSDLHFGKESEMEKTAADDRVNVLNGLLEQLSVLPEDWIPKIVVVSGDIANKAKKEEYLEAKNWFLKLLETLKLKPENMLVAPGNHDRDIGVARALKIAENWQEADELLETGRLGQLQDPFLNFQEFCENFNIPKLCFPYEDNYLYGQRSINGLSFIVLNSSWFYLPKKNEKNLWLGLPHLKHLKAQNKLINPKNFESEILTFAVFHHPPKEFLSEYESHHIGPRVPTISLLSKHAHVFLNGHLHGIPHDNDIIAGRTLQIIAGATFAEANYPNSFNLLKIKIQDRSLEQKVFTYSSADYEWVEMKTYPPAPLKSLLSLTNVEKKNSIEFSLTNIEEQIRDYFPRKALSKLEALEKNLGNDLPKALLFRFVSMKAFAFLEMLKHEEAAKFYLKSSEIMPEVEKGKVHRIYGLFLLGQLAPQNELFLDTFNEFPQNSLLNCVAIALIETEEELEKAQKNLSQELLKKPEILFSLGSKLELFNKTKEAAEFYGMAINSADAFRKPAYQSALGNLILKSEIRHSQLLNPKDLSQKTRQALEASKSFFLEAWKKYSSTEQRFFQLPVLLSLAVVNNILGNYDIALNLISEGLAIDPSSVELLTHKGRILTEIGNESGLEILQDVISMSPEKDITLIFAAAHINKGKFSECISLLADFLKASHDMRKTQEAQRLLIECYCSMNNFSEARKISDERISKYPNVCEFLAERARIERISENFSDAKLFIEKACKLVAIENQEEMIFVSGELFSLQMYQEACNNLEKIFECNDSTISRLLVKSLYFLGKEDEVLKICQEIRDKIGFVKFFVNFEYYCYEKVLDFHAAKELLSGFLEKHPSDQDLAIRLAITNSKLEDFAAVDDFLNEDHNFSILQWQDMLNLSNLYFSRKRDLEGLDLLYEARRKFFNQKEIHLAYISAFLKRTASIGDMLDVESVGLNSYVELTNQHGEKVHFILENRNGGENYKEEISTQSPWFEKLNGMKKGQSIKIPGIQEKIWEIVELKHKYVWAFQKSLIEYNVAFPDDQALNSINVGSEPEKMDFEPIFEHLSNAKTRAETIVTSFKRQELPICTFSQLIGKDLYKTWLAITSEGSDLNIVCSSGNPTELRDARNKLENSTVFILPPLSIINIHALGIADLIISYMPISVTQSTIDYFVNTIEYKKSFEKNGYQVLSSFDDKFLMEAISAESVSNEIDFLEKIVNWLKDNAEIVTSYERLGIKDLPKLLKFFGESSFDSILAAKKEGRVLLCDDEIFRKYAKELYKIQGVWLEVVLRKMRSENHISAEDLDMYLVKLIEKRFSYISFSENTLYLAAKLADWKPLSPFNKMTELLGFEHTTENSAINISVSFIKILMTEKNTFFSKDNLIFETFKGLFKGRSSNRIREAVIEEINRQFSLLPIQKGDLFETFASWLQVNQLL